MKVVIFRQRGNRSFQDVLIVNAIFISNEPSVWYLGSIRFRLSLSSTD
jgi:hypothetical protein